MLAALASIAAQASLGRIRASVRANPFAPPRTAIPDQAAVAAAQAMRPGVLRDGTSGLAGSEADYYRDAQGIGTVGYVRIAQDVTSGRLAPAWTTPGDPGAGDEPTVLADVSRGPFRRLSNAQAGNTRTVNTGHQHVINSTLLPPGMVTPSPKEMAAARGAGASHDALDSYWGD